MESNQTSSQTGSSAIDSPNVSEFNNSLNIDNNYKNGVNPIKISISSSCLNSDDDDEGFISGGEEFETASERPLDASETLDDDDDVVASPVFVKMPVAIPTQDDDDDDVEEEVEVLGGDDVAMNGGSVESVVEPNSGLTGNETSEVFTDCDEDKVGEGSKLDTYVESKGDEIGLEKLEVLKDEISKVAVESENASEVVENEDAKKVEEVRILGGDDVAVNGGSVESVIKPSLGVMGDEIVENKVDEVPILDTPVEFEGLKDEMLKATVESEKASEVVETEDVDEVEEVRALGGDDVAVGGDTSEGLNLSVIENEKVDVFAGSNGDKEGEAPKVDTHVGSKGVEIEEEKLEALKSEVLETSVFSGKGSEVVEDSKPAVESPEKNFSIEKTEVEVLEPEKSNLAKEGDVGKAADAIVDVSPDDAENSEELGNESKQTSHAGNIGDSETSINKTVDVAESGPLDVEEKELRAEFIKQMEAEEEYENVDSEEETDGMIFGGSAAAKQFIKELEREASGSRFNQDSSQEIDGQIVTDSEEEEEETDGEGGDEKEVFGSAAFAALLKAATGGGGSDGGNITITSQDGSRLFSIERPAGLGSTARSSQPLGPRVNRSALFAPPTMEPEKELSKEEKNKLDSLQKLRVKFLRLVRRLGASWDESVASQVLYRLALIAGRPNNQAFSLDAAKNTALELEAEGKDDLDFSINILVIGKCGVGKSSTINSIFGEEKAEVGTFEPGTTSVREITGVVDGVKIKVIDTPGLKSAVMEQAFNHKVLSSVKSFTKKSPPDIVLYVDRLDSQTRDLNDLPLLKKITASLGQPIWRNVIVTLTHGASAPPDGPSGNPLNYEVSVTQRSHVVQQSIGHAVGDLRMMSPSLMNPVSLVENHPMCRKNREGQKVLPNGQTWRPQLLLLCYSMKILALANSTAKPQDPFDHRKLFGFRTRSPPLPYLLSSMLQSRAHPKLPSDQGLENGDSDVDMADFSDSDDENEEEEYDQLPPFKPLRKSQIEKLSKEQRKAYFEEFDYRVKLLQKKQWREEVRRVKEMKKREKSGVVENDLDQEMDAPAPVATPLPDMVLPNSFDSDNPAYRYRFLEPTSQFLARPVLDNHGWDHDCGYDGVNLEQSLAIASKFPAAVSVQVTKDKKDFSIHLDSSVAVKHGDELSSMAGFDIQNVGKQLAYIVRGETKFKKFKKNKTAAGVTVTFLGENVAMGLKVEDQIAFNKQWAMVGSAGTVRCQGDAAYGANFELQRRELDYPIGQVQSTYGLSLIKWRGDWALGFNSVAQFSIGRNSKVALRAGINNKMSGQITVKTSSSDHLSLALVVFLPVASAIYQKLWPAAGDSYSIY